ncbi:uncharacterized protein NPIL_43081 [Nephila pilipes]|uniref:Uncharacterized protein n=1 Tax=Nephila pilipes TaxID=299642 RepID=A0A8X6QMC4_NEPPI|nr:uncharacterized protein NPIL_43081 [Nephila pilipes]
MVQKQQCENESSFLKQCTTSIASIAKRQLLSIPDMGWNRLLLLLMHLQVGMSQMSKNVMLDAQTEPVAQNGYIWPSRIFGAKEWTDCESLGFLNATKNTCGFCTGGNTKLSDRYFMDCAGKCEGNMSSVDCNGDCKGTAYIDECSGECVGGNSKLKEKDVQSLRDCRGGCVSSGVKLYTDSCGVCHTGTSPFQDCTNRCYLPVKIAPRYHKCGKTYFIKDCDIKERTGNPSMKSCESHGLRNSTEGYSKYTKSKKGVGQSNTTNHDRNKVRVITHMLPALRNSAQKSEKST